MEAPEVHPVIAAPYQDTFGMFREDPTFADFLAEVDKYRRQGDETDLHAHNPHVGVLDSAKNVSFPAESELGVTGPEVQLLGEVELLLPHTLLSEE
jgi:hypothetical protein